MPPSLGSIRKIGSQRLRIKNVTITTSTMADKLRSLANHTIMLRSIKQLYGDKLGASDGEIGHVKDFYFDDQNWAIRYLAVDTGSWLSGRQVLLSPHSLGRLDQGEKILRVNLTRKQ